MAEEHHKPASYPLTEDHLALLKDGMERLKEADGMIAKMGLAGIDTAKHREKITELRTQIRQIGNAYFTGRLP